MKITEEADFDNMFCNITDNPAAGTNDMSQFDEDDAIDFVFSYDDTFALYEGGTTTKRKINNLVGSTERQVDTDLV